MSASETYDYIITKLQQEWLEDSTPREGRSIFEDVPIRLRSVGDCANVRGMRVETLHVDYCPAWDL